MSKPQTPWIKGEPKEWESGDYFLVRLKGFTEPALLSSDEDTLRWSDEFGPGECDETIEAYMLVTPYTETTETE